MCYYLDGIRKNENILIHNFTYKSLIGAKPLRIMLDKVNRFIRNSNGTNFFFFSLFGSENVMPFSIGLDSL